MKYRDMEQHESYKHMIAKKLIFKWITEGGIALKDQFDDNIPHHDYDVFTGEKTVFYAIESPVTEQLDLLIPFASKGSCEMNCAPKHLKKIQHTPCGNRLFTTITYDEDFYKSIQSEVYATKNNFNAMSYSSHPCNNCEWNNYDYKFIFDIGIGKVSERRPAKYSMAIEVVHTSPTKEEKITYCMENSISIFEISADTILGFTDKPKELKMTALWYETSEHDDEGKKRRVRKKWR